MSESVAVPIGMRGWGTTAVSASATPAIIDLVVASATPAAAVVAVEVASDASAAVDAEVDAVIESLVVMSFTAGGDAVPSTTAAREARCDWGSAVVAVEVASDAVGSVMSSVYLPRNVMTPPIALTAPLCDLRSMAGVVVAIWIGHRHAAPKLSFIRLELVEGGHLRGNNVCFIDQQGICVLLLAVASN